MQEGRAQASAAASLGSAALDALRVFRRDAGGGKECAPSSLRAFASGSASAAAAAAAPAAAPAPTAGAVPAPTAANNNTTAATAAAATAAAAAIAATPSPPVPAATRLDASADLDLGIGDDFDLSDVFGSPELALQRDEGSRRNIVATGSALPSFSNNHAQE